MPHAGDLWADEAVVSGGVEGGEEAVQIDDAFTGKQALVVPYLGCGPRRGVGEVNVEDAVPKRDNLGCAPARVVPVPRVDQYAGPLAAACRKGGGVAQAPEELMWSFVPAMQRSERLQCQADAVLPQDREAGPQAQLQNLG